jgi:hypothetical protein
VEEVCGDSEDEDTADAKVLGVDDVDKSERKRLNSEAASHKDGEESKMDIDEGHEEKDKEPSGERVGDGDHECKGHGKERRKSKSDRRGDEEREDSPSSRALLKLYCKYCDVRHVTFRVS